MRKITELAVVNLMHHTAWKMDNTEVTIEGGVAYLKLFGNKIAAFTPDYKLWICVKQNSWFTKTTKERLNGLPDVCIVQRRGCWYLNGNYWQGEPVCVNK